jgi:hypothetical protein
VRSEGRDSRAPALLSLAASLKFSGPLRGDPSAPPFGSGSESVSESAKTAFAAKKAEHFQGPIFLKMIRSQTSCQEKQQLYLKAPHGTIHEWLIA